MIRPVCRRERGRGIRHLPAEFRRYIEAARAFRHREGHLDVPPGFVERCEHTKVRLGTWIARQRDKVFCGQLPALLIAELEALDMVWVHK
ncbi:helicase associated domain-containing protein [Streptomyces virginiae]